MANVATRGGEDINVWHGSLVAEVTELGTCSVDVFGQYDHTWSTTGISAIAVVLPPEIDVTLTSSGHQWSHPGTSSNVYNLCTH